MLVGELISGLDIRPGAVRPGDGGSGGEGREGAWRRVRVCDITEDSRTAMPGSLFVARRGLAEDGRRFIPQAVRAGAVAVLTDDPSVAAPPSVALLLADDVNLAAARIAERFYGDPSSRLSLIGVTGTNGKTTITYLAHRLLNGLGRRCGMISTVQVDDGNEVAPSSLTTPPAIEVSRTLGVMVESGCRAAVMEVSSHALEQKRAAGLNFDAAVFTNLTGDHLDYHGTMEAYAAAKAKLFAMLPAGGAGGAGGTAVVNAQDPWHAAMVAACGKGVRVLRCAVEGSGTERSVEGAECVARVVRALARSTVVSLRGPWGTVEAEVPLVGGHNVMNVLQAVAAVWAVAPWQAAEGGDPIGLAHVTAPPGRLQLVSNASEPVAVYVDYAHSDDALRNVLTVLREVVEGGGDGGEGGGAGREPAPRGGGGKLWCVFGCGGDRDRTKRPRMGRVAAELADVVVVTSDNPRTEPPRRIIDEVLGGVMEASGPKRVMGENLHVEEDRERAIALAVERAAPGDVVLIAGKGHEDYQILPDGRGGTVRRHFDDRLAARAALSARFGGAAAGVRGRGEAAAAATPPDSTLRPPPRTERL